MSKNKMFFKNKEIKDIISTALINRTLIFDLEKLTSDQISFLAKKADINRIPDDLLCLCEELHPVIDWSKFDKFKIIRMISRNKNIAKFVDLKSYNFSIKELIPCLKINPQFIHDFNLRVEDFTKNDIVDLLKTGCEYFIETIEFNSEIFTSTEAFLIVRSFDFNPAFMEKLKIFEKKLNSQYLREIIIKTGVEFIDKIDLTILEPVDWIAILKSNKNLLSYCNHDIFKRGDVFFLIEFILLFPEFKEWINETNKVKITSLGWEKLLVKFGDEMVDLCDFSIITEVSWCKIKNEQPNLIVHKL